MSKNELTYGRISKTLLWNVLLLLEFRSRLFILLPFQAIYCNIYFIQYSMSFVLLSRYYFIYIQYLTCKKKDNTCLPPIIKKFRCVRTHCTVVNIPRIKLNVIYFSILLLSLPSIPKDFAFTARCNRFLSFKTFSKWNISSELQKQGFLTPPWQDQHKN